MGQAKYKVIFDTNIWLSLLIRGGFSSVFSYVESGQIQIILSVELIDEILEVSQRVKFHKYFSTTDRASFLSFLLKNGEIIEVNSKPIDCRDPKDNFLLGLALDGKATRLITGDKDLLELNPFGGTKINSLAEFLNFVDL